MRLKVSNQQASELLETIPHQRCLNAIPAQWRVTPDGKASAQSVLWLFCWAKTGMNSPGAAQAAKEVFNQIFPIRFEEAEARIPHEYAREKRYASGDIESDINRLLAK